MSSRIAPLRDRSFSGAGRTSDNAADLPITGLQKLMVVLAHPTFLRAAIQEVKRTRTFDADRPE